MLSFFYGFICLATLLLCVQHNKSRILQYSIIAMCVYYSAGSDVTAHVLIR